MVEFDHFVLKKLGKFSYTSVPPFKTIKFFTWQIDMSIVIVTGFLIIFIKYFGLFNVAILPLILITS